MTVLAVPDVSHRTDADRAAVPQSMVGRMTLILDAFDGSSARLTLEDVARATHLPRSTVHRILDQLVTLGWLEHTPFGYRLGRRALGLAGGDGGQSELRAAAAPLLHELQMRTGMVVHLAVLDGADVLYLDKVGGRFAAAVPSRVGGRAPAHCTALGKSMLSWLDAEAVDALEPRRLASQTRRSIAELGPLHQELHRIRQRNGLTFERGECFPDIACVAAAIRGPEGPVGSISLVGGAAARLENGAPLVVDAARQVSRTLFPVTHRPRKRRPVTPVPERTWPQEALDRLVAVGYSGEWC